MTKDWTQYRVSCEAHPKDKKCTVHTFEFETDEERDAFSAAIEFVNGPGVVSNHSMELPGTGGRVKPGLIVVEREVK